MIWLLAACVGGPEGVPDLEGRLLVTTTTDFSVGAMAAVSLSDGTVADAIVPTSADPSVVVTGGTIVQLNGFQSDFVRVHDPDELSVPRAEFALPDGSNPHDAELVDGELWISTYGTTSLTAFDPLTGAALGVIALSDYADEDGVPEASDLVYTDGVLLVALQRLDRTDGWAPRAGRVLVVDPATRGVLDVLVTGTSPRLSPRPGGGAWVITGSYVLVDGVAEPALDGDVRAWSLADGLGEPVLRESATGERIDGWAEGIDGNVVALVDYDGDRYALRCGPPSGPFAGVETDRWLSDVAIDDLGSAWVAARVLTGGGGLWPVDRQTCGAGEEIATSLPPYRIAIVEE